MDEALYDWCVDAPNHVLSYDKRWIYLDIDSTDSTIEKSAMQVIQMLYKKYFKLPVLRPMELEDADVEKDRDLESFGKEYLNAGY